MSAILPDPPRAGEGVRADWGARVVAALRRRRVVAGPGVAVRETPDGVVVSAARPAPAPSSLASASGPFLATVESLSTAVPAARCTLFNLQTGASESGASAAASDVFIPMAVYGAYADSLANTTLLCFRLTTIRAEWGDGQDEEDPYGQDEEAT